MRNFNKKKALKRAEELVKQRRYAEAITEFKAIIQADPEEYNLWVRIADLYVKLNDNGEAIRAYIAAAVRHEAHGLYPESVNLLRHALKINRAPEMVTIFLKLAGLYQKIGLPKEAIAELRIAIDMHERNGHHDSCVPLLEEVLKLDPEILSSRVKLAEAYFKIGKKFESETEIENIAKRLRLERRVSDLIVLYKRYLSMNPGYTKGAMEYAELTNKVGGESKEEAKEVNRADEIRRLDRLIKAEKNKKMPLEPFSTPGVSSEDLRLLDEASARLDEANKAIKDFLKKIRQ